MSDWPRVRLGDVIHVKHGFAFKGEYFNSQGDQLVLTPGNFKIGGGIQLRHGKERFYSGPYPDEFKLSPDDLLIAMTDLTQNSPILGSPLVVPHNGVFLHNQRLGKVSIKDDHRLDRRFAYVLFASDVVRSQLRGSATGSTVRHTAPERIYRATVALPPVETQRKIASVLVAHDDLIENNDRRIELLEEMARRIYREWFVDFRYPGHENIPLVESDHGPIPQGWKVAAFTDFADVLSGGTPRTTVPEYWAGDIPFFTPRDAPDSLIATVTEKHITREGLNRCNSQLYPRGTVLITARGTVGKVVMTGVPMAMNQSCYAIRGRENISQEFVLFALLNQVAYLKTNTGGATFDTIIVDTFRRMRCVLPSLDVLSSFAGVAGPLLDLIHKLQDATAKARAIRYLMLPRLISGDVDVTNMNIAMAEDAA